MLFHGRVSYEDTFFRLRVRLISIFVRDAYIRDASEHLEMREDGLPSKEDFVRSKLRYSIGAAPIHEIDNCGCRFGSIEVRHVLLTHHGACYLNYLPTLSFGDSILLGRVSA